MLAHERHLLVAGRMSVRLALDASRGAVRQAEREMLLIRHRAQVRRHVAELQACLSVLDNKIAGYGGYHPKTEEADDADTTRDRKPVRPGLARAD